MSVDGLLYPLLLAAGATGLGLSAGALLFWLARAAGGVPFLRALRRGAGDPQIRMPDAVRRVLAPQGQREDMPGWARGWLEHARRRMARAGVNIPVGRYVAGVTLAAISGLLAGTAWLNNPPAAVVLAASAFLVPDIVMTRRAQGRRARMVEQLGVAVRIFAGEFSDTPQVLRALSRTAENVPPPLGHLLRRAVRDLIAGKDRDEVMLYLMRQLDTEYGRMFVQLLRLAWEDAAVRPLFARLAVRIGSLQALMARNQSQTTSSRWIAMGVNAAVLPMFLVTQRLVPDAAAFMTTHPVGKLLVFLSFVSVLLGLLMDRMLTEVDA